VARKQFALPLVADPGAVPRVWSPSPVPVGRVADRDGTSPQTNFRGVACFMFAGVACIPSMWMIPNMVRYLPKALLG
jgi:hypothetical protein